MGMRIAIWAMVAMCMCLPCCRHVAPDLPTIDSAGEITTATEIERNLYPLTREGDWLHAIDCAELLVKQCDSGLESATQLWYALLLSSAPGALLPTLQENDQRRQVLGDAVRHQAFAELKLSDSQQQQASKSWGELQRCERRMLFAGTVVAELRQKWFDVLRCECPPSWCWPRLHQRIAGLPSLATLESWREFCQLLLVACRQLLAHNPSLMPPLE